MTVSGLAVTTQQADFPHWDPGLAWAAPATVERIGGAQTGMRIGLRLADLELPKGRLIVDSLYLIGQYLIVTGWVSKAQAQQSGWVQQV